MEKYVIDHQLYEPNGVHTNRFVPKLMVLLSCALHNPTDRGNFREVFIRDILITLNSLSLMIMSKNP